MYLNNFVVSHDGSKRYSRRLGRGIGSGRGKTCGRGHKGQKSRSGVSVRRNFEGGQSSLYRRLPKFGFVSKKSLLTAEVRLSELKYIRSNIIDVYQLKVFNIISKNIKFVKLILSGSIDRPIIVRGLRVSKGACIAIKRVGGIVEDK
ncbi:MAG: 50S ribosomal subunit protein L15 [Candidatus Westeberhardia cardiocondylae]|nr:50S ribosomal subunit protein L15 [Candidatus Westeberhardia cardiocondylae]